MTADFNNFLTILKDDIKEFARENLEEYKDELIRDGSEFITKSRDDLKRWTAALASGALSKEDFEFLLKAKKDLAEMKALKQLGLSKIRINKLTKGIIDIVVGSAIKTFL